MELNKIYHENCLTGLKNLPENSVDCCVTSPPYFGLRDYGTAEQIGLEETPELFVYKLVDVFNEVRRVLKGDGTLWLNLGDSYAGSGQGKNDNREDKGKQKTNIGSIIGNKNTYFKTELYKPKDLIGIPWMVAFALRSSGWYLRQDIIWHKPNPMPESVTDRCTKSHEYIFLLSKSVRYYYDALSIATPYQDKTLTTFGCEVKGKGDGTGLIQSENWAKSIETRKPKVWKTPDGWDTGKGSHGSIHREGRSKGKSANEKSAENYGINGNGFKGHSGNYDKNGELLGSGKANKRSVWTIPTIPYSEAHFATFPERLITDCIKAGCPIGGTVLDPFMGAGTTALVARKLDRNFIGFELNEKYIQIAEKRLRDQLGMFI